MLERLLVVDAEPSMALAMERTLRRRGHAVESVPGAAEALAALARAPYAVMVTDLRMPGIDGRELLGRVRALAPRTRIVVVTAFGTVESAVACVREGAVDFLLKPFSPEALEQAVAQALRQRAGTDRGPADQALVAEDPLMLATVELALRAARSDVTVLLEAESGAGKEVLARLIHRESPRATGPFVAVNCAALPRDLLEAELFGHRRGAFTGALRDHKGHFEAADHGTLLLDEIGEMSADLQSRLLRVLQDHVVQPVGAEATLSVDVRVIAATNRNLRDEVAAGRFREDLYYRLRVMPIHILPLRERPRDVEPLAQRFVREICGAPARLTAAALGALSAHDWPGNVRELQNVLQRAAILAGEGPIDVEHLILESAPRDTADRALAARPAAHSLEDAEREAISRTLARTGGNRMAAAAALGISPRTLRHKLKQYRDAGLPLAEPAR
jgi:two-component system, response regulator FlrC